MRYGIFSDIHGNLEALEAVLESFLKEKVDRCLHIGDIVGYGADPSKCIKAIEKLSCVGVAGNHDWAASDLYDPVNFNEAAREAVLWTEAVLSWEEIGFLKSLELVFAENDFTLVHGTLESPGDFNYMFDRRDARSSFTCMRTRLCFIGHTHVPGIFMSSKGVVTYSRVQMLTLAPLAKYIINVGSVGQPRDGNPRAAYAIYDDEKETVAIKRVEYDVKKAQDKILKAGLPSILAYRLSVGG